MIRLGVLFLASLWPALVSGGALWFPDIAPYVRGGHLAVETLLAAGEGEGAAGAGAALTDAAPGESQTERAAGLAGRATASVSGVRSVAYSVFAYLGGLAAPAFWGVALIQAALLAGLVSILARREGGPLWLWAGVLALSAAPLSASSAGPDVFAGLLFLSALIVFRYGRRLTAGEAGLVLGTLAFGVAAHASHVLLAGALALGVLLLGTRTQRRAGVLLAGGVAVGVAGVLAASLIGFGEASLAPKRYPIVLARAIEDGPALWHLQDHCDEHGYTVCEVFPDGIPDNVGSFLWREGGVRDRASPAQMEAIRAEEALILRRAFAEYPFFQLRKAGGNFARQLATFIETPRLGSRTTYLGGGEVASEGTSIRSFSRLSALAQGLVTLGGLLLVAALAFTGALRLDRDDRRLLCLLALGLAANAAVCGVLSVPEARYQARIVWVLPVIAAALLVRAPIIARRLA